MAGVSDMRMPLGIQKLGATAASPAAVTPTHGPATARPSRPTQSTTAAPKHGHGHALQSGTRMDSEGKGDAAEHQRGEWRVGCARGRAERCPEELPLGQTIGRDAVPERVVDLVVLLHGHKQYVPDPEGESENGDDRKYHGERPGLHGPAHFGDRRDQRGGNRRSRPVAIEGGRTHGSLGTVAVIAPPGGSDLTASGGRWPRSRHRRTSWAQRTPSVTDGGPMPGACTASRQPIDCGTSRVHEAG